MLQQNLDAAPAAADQADTGGEIVAYKAFDANLSCRGHQFEVGKTYELSGAPVICSHGFHACEHPFDVFNYYPLGSRVARVSMSGAIDRKKGGDEDSKICGLRIAIDAELRMPEIIKAAVAYILKVAKGNTATGYRGHAAATGYRGHAAVSGDRGHAAATGYSGHAAATGDSGHAAATGYSGHAAATGYRGHAAATGDSGHAAVSGHGAIAASLGIAGTATAEAGGAISLGCFAYNDETNRYDLVAVRSSLVGENGVQPGKVYRLSEDGAFLERAA